MKKEVLTCCILFLSFAAFAQQPISIKTIKPQYDAGQNISQRLFNDSNITSTVVWVKEYVAPHFHNKHSEQFYVVEGEGQLMMNDSNTVYSIKAGDLIFVPVNTIYSIKVTSAASMKLITFNAPGYDGMDNYPADIKW